ncbi:MAG: hypothetical protein JKX76_01675 [Colwellia sp.]|nr:hypothetical protein [Colwellia sp.]
MKRSITSSFPNAKRQTRQTYPELDLVNVDSIQALPQIALEQVMEPTVSMEPVIDYFAIDNQDRSETTLISPSSVQTLDNICALDDEPEQEEHPMDSVGLFTFLRTYARRHDDDDPNSTIETWRETCNRVIEASNTQLGIGFTEEEKLELFDSMYNLKGVPAGRFLWQLGTTTVDKNGLTSLQNCFAESTRFLTDKGVKCFNDFNDGEDIVVCGREKWLPARVHSFGSQQIFELVVQRTIQGGISSNDYTQTETFLTTAGHRWIVCPSKSSLCSSPSSLDATRARGWDDCETVITTDSLEPGNFLKCQSLSVLSKDNWTVISVTPSNEQQQVWCISEPQYQEFTLECGILTKNCAFTIVDEPIDPFTWTMKFLMLGSGVGYRILPDDVKDLPVVKAMTATREDTKDADYIVPDSRQGWVKLLGKVLKAHFYSGEDFTYSLTLLRSKGAPIKGFGGVASGPDSLHEGISKIHAQLNKCAGRKIRPIDALDIMNIIGQIVIAGNVRRCLPEDSIVFTKNGQVKIQDIDIGTEVLTTSGYSRVTNKFDQGPQQIMKITTEEGEFLCTPNHRMALIDPTTDRDDENKNYIFKEAQKLTSEDSLVTTRTSIMGVETFLPAVEYVASTTTNPFNIFSDFTVPEIDSEIAWFLGFIRSFDSSNGKVKIYICNKNQQKKFMRCLKKFNISSFILCFPGTIIYINDADGNTSYVRDGTEIFPDYSSSMITIKLDDVLTEYLSSHQLYQIPDYIKNSLVSTRLCYLSGIYDSVRSSKSVEYLVSSSDKNYICEMQTLLYSCGIGSRVFDISQKAKKMSKKISGFFSPKSSFETTHRYQLILLTEEEPYFITSSESPDTTGCKIACTKVLSVEMMNEESKDDLYNTWDIEVENDHEFMCNGYLTHNSAQIALGDCNDPEYLSAKDWSTGDIPNWRAYSNNSVMCNDIEDILQNDKFWNGYEGKGEPYGLINLGLAKSCGRTGETQYPDPEVGGTNPCFPGDTIVYTDNGAKKITDLIGKTFNVNYNGNNYSCENGFYSTGIVDSLLKLTTREGYTIRSTANHLFCVINKDETESWVEMTDIHNGDNIRMGIKKYNVDFSNIEGYSFTKMVFGRESKMSKLNKHMEQFMWFQSDFNTVNISRGYLFAETVINHYTTDSTAKAQVPPFDHEIMTNTNNDFDFKAGFLSRLFYQFAEYVTEDSVIGINVFNQFSTQAEQIDEKSVGLTLEYIGVGVFSFIQQMLLEFDVFSEIKPAQSDDTNCILIIKDEALLTFFGRVAIAHSDYIDSFHFWNRMRTTVMNDFSNQGLFEIPEREYYTCTVDTITVQELPFPVPVYDCTVPEISRFNAGGFDVHNCGEQFLAKNETCCLAEVFLPNIKSYDELITTIKYLYRICKHSLNLSCPASKETEDIVHKNFRMGIGMTGYLMTTEEQKSWLSPAYEWLRAYDVEYSAEHGFPISIKLTTIKPSGTLSLLGGTSSGIHPSFARYYIRRIRISAESQLVNIARDHGYHIEYQRGFDGTDDRSTMVISFPYSLPDTAVLAEDITAIDQLEYCARIQREWSDNAVSVSVYYTKSELPGIKEWLRENYNNGIKSVSFILHSEHGFDQAPLEKITKAEFNAMKASTRPISNLEGICFTADDERLLTSGCASGTCPIR